MSAQLCQLSSRGTGVCATEFTLHGVLSTSLISTEKYGTAQTLKLMAQPISQTSFWYLPVGFSVPFWETDGATELQIRMPEMNCLTMLPQISGQRCDRWGCHLVYFLQHNHKEQDGLRGLNSPSWVNAFSGITQEWLPKECQTSTREREGMHMAQPHHQHGANGSELPRLWDS